MSPVLIASLSLVPGVGHWAVGKKGKAVALFFIDCGIIGAIFFLKSNVGYLLTFLGYLIVTIPAVFETYALARGGISRFSESKPYIVTLLLVKGFWALPLLWRSRLFSKRNKMIWSVAVPALAMLYFYFFYIYGIPLFNYLKARFG